MQIKVNLPAGYCGRNVSLEVRQYLNKRRWEIVAKCRLTKVYFPPERVLLSADGGRTWFNPQVFITKGLAQEWLASLNLPDYFWVESDRGFQPVIELRSVG